MRPKKQKAQRLRSYIDLDLYFSRDRSSEKIAYSLFPLTYKAVPKDQARTEGLADPFGVYLRRWAEEKRHPSHARFSKDHRSGADFRASWPFCQAS